MKVCLITTSFPRSKEDAAGIFIARTVAALEKLNVQGTVLAPFQKGVKVNEVLFGWKIIRVKYGVLAVEGLAYGSGILPNLKANPLLFLQIPWLFLFFTIAAFKNAKTSDIIHAHWIFSALPALIAGAFLKIPVIVSVRGEDLKLLKIPVLGLILRILIKKYSTLTTVSEEFKEVLEKLLEPKKIHLVKNGVTKVEKNPIELSKLLQKLRIETKEYAIFASRVIPLKRIELLIDILSGIKKQNFNLLICGDLSDTNYHQTLKEIISKLNLQDRVHFIGLVDPQDYGVLLSGAKFYFSASEYEGRPNAVLEALASAVPVIASDIEAHKSLIKNMHNGLLFSDKNLKECTEQIEKILQNDVLYGQMSQNAAGSLAGESWENCAKKYLQIYESTINQNTT